ncbi:MAG: hypothetical protein ACE5FA_11735, partial [Dehalococcoidia bacterium]
MFRFCQLFKTDRLENVFPQVENIHFTLDEGLPEIDPSAATLFTPRIQPRILLVASPDVAQLYTK